MVEEHNLRDRGSEKAITFHVLIPLYFLNQEEPILMIKNLNHARDAMALWLGNIAGQPHLNHLGHIFQGNRPGIKVMVKEEVKVEYNGNGQVGACVEVGTPE